MSEGSSVGPIVLGDSIAQLLTYTSAGQTIDPTMTRQLRNALRRLWEIMDEIVVERELNTKFNNARIGELLDQRDDTRAEAKRLIERLDAQGIDGDAQFLAICQEREPSDIGELVTQARELAKVS